LREVINLIQKWSNENNLYLNPGKSGIVPFQQRRRKNSSQFILFEDEMKVDKKSGRIKIVKIPKIQTFKESQFYINTST